MWQIGYSLLLWLMLPWVLAKLWWRGRREPGYRDQIGSRFGSYQVEPPAGPLIWIHAVSVGETRAAQPLVEALLRKYPGHGLLLTHMTASGREAARQLYGAEKRIHLSWLPYDYAYAARRFLRHFRPSLGVLMETELWPNLLAECAAVKLPLLLANGRLSQRSADRYALVGPLIRTALLRFSTIAVQTEADAEQFRRLGARHLEIAGNLKFEVMTPPAAAALAAEFRKRYGARKVLLAASLRDGEESLLIDAVQMAGGLINNGLLVIVPRHPQRFDEVAALLSAKGLAFVRRSQDRDVPEDCPCVLGDSMGEMASYYAAADCAFVGGSLLEYGGQNLIEACAAGVPALIGPHTYNFAEAAEAAVAAGAALRLADANSVIETANCLLGNDELRWRMGSTGLEFCRRHQGAVSRIVDLCQRLLPA
jgi:3-deoxy-D-manno-octulosonic-acid transferase